MWMGNYNDYNKRLNFVIDCHISILLKILHHSISDCHVSILLKIQYILSHIITSQ